MIRVYALHLVGRVVERSCCPATYATLPGMEPWAIVVRIAAEVLNRVVLTIFTDQLERGASMSTMHEPSVSYSAEMAPGRWQSSM